MFEYVEKLQARIATMVSQNEAGIRPTGLARPSFTTK